jgi:hypothetical protein
MTIPQQRAITTEATVLPENITDVLMRDADSMSDTPDYVTADSGED